MAQIEYVPGVCNIGPEEIASRRSFGWAALAATIVLLALLLWTGINPWWRLLIFFPATLCASGFLQAYFHFCVGFARAGVFNFGPRGSTQPVTDQQAKAKDRTQGTRVTLYAALIGLAVALACVFI